MNLFTSAGVDLLPGGGGGRRPAPPRSLRTPLFAFKVVQAARARLAFAPSDAERKAARDYARKARAAAFSRLTEEAVRPLFFDVLTKLLGYRMADPEAEYSLAFERRIRRGAVDVALGRFDDRTSLNAIVAPFELKGPQTIDLDAPMPGRGRSPVQQAWDYAVDAPGARWVLVSNCREIRLYGFGRGRDAYETFDLTRLDEEEEHARLWMMLSADRLLAGELDRLLRETDSAYKDITEDLYAQYKELRTRLVAFLTDSVDGPRLSTLAAIEPAQKILDRILFIAFAQRTDLLPDRILERAAKARNEFAPNPLWSNFTALFRAVDVGSTSLSVWPYNGGLFAPDAIVDALTLPDALAAEVAALGQWDYRSEVSVTLLGHIFEQSITDIERLKAEGRGEAPPRISQRKRAGVVYTPDLVTRFIVEKTIGEALREAFEAASTRHGLREGASAEAERACWGDYLAALRALTAVDPACGSGAFLVAAFDLLAGEYRRAEKALDALGAPIGFDIYDEIVSRNLYGVDVNPESVEITRLSLWLKTARRDHRLQNLDATIRLGDSLIEDGAFTAHPFDWRAAFPHVLARGGFDIVIGNPPYVRMELLKTVKPYLETHYAVASDRADLYAYFYERGIGLVRDGGRLGFISSSTFFRTGSGEPLRALLSGKAALETVVDFGETQLFEGVTTYPAILVLRKAAPLDGGLAYLVVDGEVPAELGRAFEEAARPMPRARLGAGAWRFESDALARLRDKIVNGRPTLREVYGEPLYGIKTGLNEAFVIDTPTRDRLVRADPKSAELLKPFLRGEDVRRWRVEPQGLWLIDTPRGRVDIDAYPAVRDWLTPFRPALEQRATQQEWWELQQAQLAYQPKFQNQKIIYGHFAQSRAFSLDRNSYFSNDKTYFIPNQAVELLSLLNSSVLWFVLSGLAPAVRDVWRELRVQYVGTLPVPELTDIHRARLAELAEACTTAARDRLVVETAVRRRILDLAPAGRAKLTGKLHGWRDLDFAAFRAAIKQAFRADIPVRERADWETYLADNAARVRGLSAAIAAAEREIDAIVYALFSLTPAEIALVETSLQGQR